MRPSEWSRALLRATRFETFEERLALSVQPFSELAYSLGPQLEHHYGELSPLEQIEEISPVGDFQADAGLQWRVTTQASSSSTLAAHELTGVNYVYNTFGFDGGGQTVAVIDSGIAWDHVALGGGLGSNFRVVGGYDFAENDRNPYDDGPAGFHGTHVAGIIGNSSTNYRGVAAGVDLVGLRVFDDNGAGYFSWVEQALRWVHENRNAFRNPITTVNLSLGTAWNAETVPNWTTIEDEFQQLKADGIFIAVSAGNSFADYKKTGLSYPAASPYVVPVASVDNSGSLSDFSQRSARVIAAPGRSIASTVPDHVFGSDGVKNDFAAASGTSMAAPYAAGASTLVRQAMQFIGRSNITEDTIYTHLRNTADTVYDAVTKANYFRINVRRAIESLMPTDDYGSTVATAKSLGTVSSNAAFKGVIGTVTDTDFFSFTAANSGRLSFQFNTTHDLVLNARVVGGSATLQGQTLSLDVVAGQKYSLSVGTKDGIGYYTAKVKLDSGPTKLGEVSFRALENQQTDATTWYELTAARTGQLTVETLFNHTRGNVDLELYSESQELLGSSKSLRNGERVDVTVTQGQKLFIKLVGANQDVDLRITNLLAQNGTTLNVFGTADADQYALTVGSNLTLAVNGTTYTFAHAEVRTVNFDGGAGQDILRISGDAASLTLNRNDVLTASSGDSNSNNGSSSGNNSSGSSTTNDVARRAYELDRAKNLKLDGDDHQNWGGRNEKWLKGKDGWYFIIPEGKVYKWNGKAGATGTLVETLDASYYQDLGKLHDAKLPPAAATSSVVTVASGQGVAANFLPPNDAYIVTLSSAHGVQQIRTNAADQLFAATAAADEDHATSSRPVSPAVRAAYFIQQGQVPVRVAVAASLLKPARLEPQDELGTLDSVFDDLGCDEGVAWDS